MNKMREALESAIEVTESLAKQLDSDELWTHLATLKEALAAEPEPAGENVVCPDNDKVICPKCVHQFRAIPFNVQKLMIDAGFEPPFTRPPAQPEPAGEPVAWMYHDGPTPEQIPDDMMGTICFSRKKLFHARNETPLYTHPAPESVRKLVEAVHRLLSLGGAIAEATDELLHEAVNDTEADPIVREQAAAVLECRAALAEVRAEQAKGE